MYWDLLAQGSVPILLVRAAVALLHPPPPAEQLPQAGGTMQAKAGTSQGTRHKGQPCSPRKGHTTRKQQQQLLAVYQEGTMTHPRRASGDGDTGSAASCCLTQEGITQIQMLGSDPTPCHSSLSYEAMASHPAKLREQSARDPRPH